VKPKNNKNFYVARQFLRSAEKGEIAKRTQFPKDPACSEEFLRFG
jgi:hypothetical protein